MSLDAHCTKKGGKDITRKFGDQKPGNVLRKVHPITTLDPSHGGFANNFDIRQGNLQRMGEKVVKVRSFAKVSL